MGKNNQYDQIVQLWKSERQTKKILEVKSVVYSTIRQKITQLEKDLEKLDKKEIVSRKVIEERIKRLNRILHDLTKIRTHKLIHEILNETVTNDLAAEEIDLVKNLKKNFDNHNTRSILGEFPTKIADEAILNYGETSTETELMTVRILEDLPEIIDAFTKGKEKKIFGPFKKEDIVRLPLVYAKTLIMKNAADRIDLPEL